MQHLRVLVDVLLIPRYVAAAAVVAAGVFTGAVWLPNTSLIIAVFQSSSSLLDKLALLGTLYSSIGTNFTVMSAISTVLIAILFGVNIALLAYYVRKKRTGVTGLGSTGGAGIAGLVSGFLGVGCAACGTFILSSVLVLIGAGGILAYLPFGGEEFGFIGVGLLLYSIFAVSKKITASNVC